MFISFLNVHKTFPKTGNCGFPGKGFEGKLSCGGEAGRGEGRRGEARGGGRGDGSTQVSIPSGGSSSIRPDSPSSRIMSASGVVMFFSTFKACDLKLQKKNIKTFSNIFADEKTYFVVIF